VPLAPLLAAYDHVVLDLDGCVRVGDQATPRAGEAVLALRDAGKGVVFVTNDPARAPEEVVRQLWGLGVQASVAQVVTVGSAIQHVCADAPQLRTAFVIGPTAVHRHVIDAGLRVLNHTDLATRVDVVVVAAHPTFDYAELRTATQAVLHGAAILAAGRDATFPMPDGHWPGTGAVVAALEQATGAVAESVGKPEAPLFRTALDRLGATPGSRVLVVGDRIDADVAGARAAGLDAALVLTGVTGADAAAALLEAPDGGVVAVAPTLGDLVLGP
jgi:HAD superfamily hydrolase (TIGR01450 family)